MIATTLRLLPQAARLLAGLFGLVLFSASAAADSALALRALPAALDLSAHARQAMRLGEPLIVVVTVSGCRFCEQIKRDHLLPMQRSGRYEIRELDMGSSAQLIDFDGQASDARAWARAQQVRVTPTVLLLAGDGRRLAAPLVGASIPDFYGSYLQQALDEARQQMRRAR